jgi:hypothetical protein
VLSKLIADSASTSPRLITALKFLEVFLRILIFLTLTDLCMLVLCVRIFTLNRKLHRACTMPLHPSLYCDITISHRAPTKMVIDDRYEVRT